MLRENLYSVITMIVMMLLIILIAYYTTIFIAKKSNLYFRGKSVKVLERIFLFTNLTIVVIQIIDEVYILGVNSKNIELIDKIKYENWINYKKTETISSEKSILQQKHLLDVFKNILYKNNKNNNLQ